MWTFLVLTRAFLFLFFLELNMSHQVHSEFLCASPGGLRFSKNFKNEVLLCPYVRYTFGKILKLKLDGIRGWIRKHRYRNNLIIYINSQAPVHHNIKVSENYTVIFKLLQPLESEFLAKFAKRPVRNDFFLSPIK